jgi:hypothetical protein
MQALSLFSIAHKSYTKSIMSIRFVASLDETPSKPNFIEVGTRILFTMVAGKPQPYEVIEPDGSRFSIGIPVIA